MTICRLISTLSIALATSFTSAHAHLLHQQEATLRLDGEKGYLAVAVPATAFSNVDDDADGHLSPQEIAVHREEISRQFRSRFRVRSPEGAATIEFAWVTNPADSVASNNPEAPTRYVIIMAGAKFKSAPTSVAIETDLFGEAPDERMLRVRARRDSAVETGVLSQTAPKYEFFANH